MTLPQLLESAADRYGDRPFLLTDGDSLSYGECFARANGLARLLAGSGVAPGDCMAAVLPNGPELVLTWFALGRLGAVLLPLNPALLPQEVEPLLRQAGASALIAGAVHLEAYGSFPWKLKVQVGEGEMPGAVPFAAPLEPSAPPCLSRPEDLAAILQTSGTTGGAKGACLTHRGYTWPAREFARFMEVVPEDRFLGCLPLFHMAGQAFLSSALAGGASMTLIPQFSAHRFWDQVRAGSITLTRHLGEMLAVLLRLPKSPLDREHTLRAVYGGGARPEVAEAFERRFGAVVVEGYGLTETNTVLRNELRNRRRGSIGRPMPFVEARIASASGEALAPSQPGEPPRVGEIQIRRNPVMMTGYLGEPDLAASCFTGEWFRTGDLGSMDTEGWFYFEGREKDIIRRRGESILPARIEQILERHASVASAMVVGAPDEFGGEEVKAYLICRPGHGHEVETLIEWCRGELADFEIPRYFEICSEFPRSATEKVSKARLRQMGTTGAPCFDRRTLSWTPGPPAEAAPSLAPPSSLDECRTLVDVLRLRAQGHPELPVYTFLANGTVEAENLTYGELDRRAREIAVELLRTARPGDRAVLLYPPGLEFIAALFGCFYAGVVAVPAYPPRPNRTNSRLQVIVEESRPGLVLTTAALAARAEPLTREIPRLAEARWVATEGLPGEADAWRAPDLDADSLAFLQYTSGSTSDPKGVMVSHGNFLANERMIRDLCGHSEQTVFVGWLPLYHDMGLMGNVIQPLYIGGQSILMAPSAFLSSPVRWLEAISRYRATTSGGPNFAYDLCVRKIAPEQRHGLDLSSWTVAFNGAEPIRAETLERFAEAFAGSGFSRSAFFPCYGLAEATLLVTGSGVGNGPLTVEIDSGALARHEVVRSAPGAPEGRTMVSSGRLAEALTLVVADPESRTPCAPGRVGEIWVSGPSVAQGYWNRPEPSAEIFGARLADGSGPFLRTGDLGYLDGGELYVTGRVKDLIILRGRNHYPQDIELTAELAHPALQPGSTAAFSIQVEGEERLAVLVERRPRSKEGIENVAPAVRRAVVEEHEIQVHVVALVPPGTVLKTSSGKVRRRACRELLLTGQLESVGVSWAGEEEAAWTGEALRGEDLLALDDAGRRAALAAWLRQEAGRALKLDPARLPARQPLTALGLDSLGAVELEQRITDGLGVELPASGLLEGASLDDLAEHVLARLSAGATALLPVAARRVEAPLSAMQKALWFEQQLVPESPAYNIPFAARLGAGVDVAALRQALEALVVRHAPLRSVVTGDAQRFAAEATLAFTEREVPGEAELQAEVTAEAHRPFDLDRGPLFRAVLFTTPGNERVLLLAVHHIAFDGWSLWVLLDELRLLYEGAVSGREASLPALPAEYADFVLWQEEMLASPAGERLWQFWRAELPAGMPPFQLPGDRQGAGPGWRGAAHRFPVDPELIGQLKGLAREEGATLYAVLLAAYQALLARSTGQLEVVVGSAVSGRSRPEFRGLVGCLFNTVPLRADLAEDPTFRGLLRQARGRLAAALAHQDYPSHRLAERLRSGREAGGAPFFQTHFLYQKPQRGEAPPRLLSDGSIRLDLGCLVLDALFLEQETARSGLELEVFEADEAVSAWFRYSTALFDAATVERLARHFTILLTEAVRGADRPVSELPLLDAAERDLLLRTWSTTGLEFPETAPIHALFAEQAARTPEKVAAICGDEPVLYRELDERSGRLARRLAALDGDLVGLMVEPDHPLLAGMLGILKAGKGFVPLDPDTPAERLERMIADSGFAVLVTDRRNLAKAQELGVPHVVCLDSDDLETLKPLAMHGGAGEGIAYVIFTSGSTGVPKGVPITHENLVPLLLWSREVFGFGEPTRVLQSLSYAFDFGVFEILTTLLFGGTLVLRGGTERGDIEAYLEQVRRHEINTIHTTPSFFRAVANAAAAAGERLDRLAVLHLGGEALSEGLVEEAFAVSGAECRLFNGYGPTEASVNCALYEVGRAAEWRPRGLSSVPIGHPSAANRLYVLDRWMQPVPVGSPGELFVGGVGLSRGYLNRPDLTAARFVPSSFGEPGGRLYRTGDLVRFHGDGAIEFLGRVDHQVKVRGYRIELEEIEAALAAHPEVGVCAVVAWRPEGGEARLVAYAAPRSPEVALDAAELRSFLGDKLPAYMVPAAFTFLPELPLSTSGKVDRRALPPPGDAQPAVPYAAPRTPLERALAGIWSRSLGVERVGIHDDFFELGGHSLLGTRIIAQIRKDLGVEVALRTFFEASTIAELARAVEGASRVDLPPIRRVPRDGELPLSFAQERIWFLTQLNPELRSYFVPRALRVRGRFDPALVETTFSEINRRHEILRTTFPSIDGRPVQVIQPPFRMSMPVVDLSALPAEVREQEMRRRMLVEGRRPFDLTRGPLLRLTLLRLAEEEHTLVITEHHLVHDGWTQGVLLKDFLTLYAAFSRGEPSPLPELPVQYADFAVWQRLWLRDDVLDLQLSWWKERLAGAPTLLELPTDRPRPAVQSFHGHQVTWVLPGDLSREMRAAGRHLGATLFMFMLSAWDTLMMRLSGQEDLCIGTGVANRRVVEAEGILGMVINTLVLRADLSGTPTFAELVARIREVCVGAYGHQDLPFEKLVNALRLERSLSHTPLFQVFFAFLDTPMPELEVPGLSIGVLDAHNRSAKFDINVTVLLPSEQRVGMEVAREDEITLLFEYSTDLFDQTTVLRLLEHYQVLLEAAVADAGLRLPEMPLLGAAEAHQLRSEWSDTAVPSAEDLCLHELVFAQARRTPEATAVRCGEERLTYDELAGRARQLAAHLRDQGIVPGCLIGLAVDRSPEMVVSLLGVLASGAAYVPLDPTWPRERLALMIEDARPALLLTEGRLAGALPERPPLFFLERMGEEPAGSPAEAARPAPGDLAYVLYTSGSTGRPKGVAIPHRAVVNFLAGVRRSPGLAAHDALLALTTLSFDIAVLEIFLPLSMGATVVVATREEARGGAELRAVLADPAITALQATPATWRLLLESGWEGNPRLKALCGGEALPRELADRLLERCGELWNLYGPTETTVWSMVQRVAPGHGGSSLVPVGRPLGNTSIHLLDRGSASVPIGVPGELWIGGAGLALGYLGRPDLTAAAFRPDPFAAAPGARLYRTGDLARRLPDGTVEFLGRIDHQVKVRGFRIELGEIEACLARHPAVQAAAAAVYEAAPGDRRIAAYLVGEPVAVDALRSFLAGSLPEYMLPAAWLWLEALPLTPNGKVDRRALPRPESSRPDSVAGLVTPRTELERALADAWCEVLGTVEVGVLDNFFVLGGHSLLATRLMARIESRLGAALPLRTLFEAPTVATLAARVEHALAGAYRLPAAPPLVGGPRPAELPLSFAQERLWFLDRIEGASAAYNIPSAIHLAGDLDPAALGRALEEVVRRHEALRTRFEATGGEPRQVIEPARPVPLPVIDLDGAAGTEALRLARAEAARPFDLTCPPLLRACLLRRGPGDHLLVLVLHHIAADGWSLGLLVRELAAFYQGQTLPELPLQYADFALWQRRWLSGEVIEQEISWWRERLAGAPEEISLPTDRPRNLAPARRGEIFRATLPLPTELASVCRERQATLFMVLFATFASLLARWSGDEDLVVGSPVANRTRVETEGLIGFFVNLLPLRVDLAGQPEFETLLARVREWALAAYAHQNLPFEKLVEALQPQRHLGRTPLFQVLFVLQNAPFKAVEIPGLSWNPLPLETGSARFDLTLSLSETGGGLAAALDFRTDLFDRTTAGRLLSGLATLLPAAVADPARRIEDLPLLSEAERQALLVEWNATAAAHPQELCLHELIEAQADRTPGAVAVRFEGEDLTYGDLDRRANRLARHLRSLGVGPEVKVGIAAERSLDLVVGLLAILKAGGAYVPIDPAYPEERLAYMLADARVPVLLTQSRIAASLPGSGARPVLLDEAGTFAAESAERLGTAMTPDNLAYVIYTSGSTGRPKGAMNTHRAIVNRLLWMQAAYGLDDSDCVLQKTPFSFDVSVWEFFAPLVVGARLVVARPGGHQDPAYLVRLIGEQRVTTLHFVPSMLSAFLEEPDLAPCRTLRRVIASGEALSLAHQERFFARLGRSGGCGLHNLYGPTEAAVEVTSWACEPGAGRRSVPIGRPIDNLRIHILDSGLRPVPVGVTGHLHIGGVGLARGYHDRPDLTAERFIPDPVGGEPGARAYATGDLARHLADGAIEYLGRIDHQVKVRGFRIELGEIEACLTRHPGVLAAAAAVYEPTPGDRRIAAYLVAASRPAPGADELRHFLAGVLPDYMVPAAWVWLEALPLTPNHKLDRKALPWPGSERPELAAAFVAPRTELERTLAAAWCEVLGIGGVGIHDNFFALGGHSLLAARLIARIESRLGVSLPLRTLFEAPTLAALAGKTRDALAATSGLPAAPPLAAGSRPAVLPLSFAQERLWLLDQLEGASASYNIPLAVHLAGDLDTSALARAVDAVVRRHEALRTRFEAGSGEPRQVIEPALPVPLPIFDLAGASEAEVFRRAAAEALQPFDLTRPPLLRACLLRRSAGDHLLVLNLHHIAADGWSLGVLVRELANFYQGQTLPELPVQYADFALWQRRWLSGETLEREVSWWREQLAGVPEEIPLPTDRLRTVAPSNQGGRCRALLPLPAELGPLCRERQATLFMVLLTAFAALLARWSGEEDLVVGSPVANRNRVETEGLIGFFVNMLPLRVDLAGRPTFLDLLARVREGTLAALAHQDLPFEKLVEALQPARHPGRTPLFQVSFVLQNAPFEAVKIPGLSWSPRPLETGTAKFDLSLSLTEEAGGLSAALGFRTDLFDAATAERLLEHFGRLLAAAADAPDRRPGELPLLSAAERHAALLEGNDTARPLGETRPIHRIFEERAAATPDALALVAGRERLTFRELDGRANAIAHRLRRQGIGPESRVGLMAGRSAGVIAGLLGILKAGGAYVPVDPSWPAERRRWALADSGADLLLDGDEPLPTEITASRAAEVDLDNAAYVLYTSGSTGRPKGVAVRHGSVLNLARALFEGVYGGDPRPLRVGLNASLAFDGSVKQLLQLVWGHTLCLIPEEARLDPSALVELVRRERLDVLDCTPSQLRLLLAAGLAADPQEGPRLVLVGGEAIDRETWESARSRPWTRFINVYGPTECTVDATASPFSAMAVPGALGRPLANVQVHVVDREGGPSPVGIPGEIWIGGAGLARGYLGRPDLTAERFVPDPFGGEPGARLYRSGDLARRLADGGLDYLGRTDHQVKVRGFRIELGEIEARLALHPAVRAAAVGVYEAAPGDLRIAAWLVAADGPAPGTDELRRFLAASLPEPMLPSAWIWLPALPLNASGKVDRKALPRPEAGRPDLAAALVAPRTDLERTLAEAWSEVLGTGEVGVHDNFFERGGHSLLATRLVARVESRLGVALPLRALFEAPTVASLAAEVEQALAAASGLPPAPPLVAGPRPEVLPLSFAQERLWLLDQLEGAGSVYNIPAAVRLSGALDPAALGRALSEVVRRHEALRTRFEAAAGEPRQVIEPPRPVPLPVVDLAGASEAEALGLAASETGRPFDLGRPPLLRACLLRRGTEDHLLLLTLHHIAADGWSLGVLVRELAAFYQGETLAALPVQYADFALWQRQWLSGDTLAQEVAWWRERLSGASEEISLPTDRPRTAAPSAGGAVCRTTLPLSRELGALGRERQATLFMILLSAFAALLARWSGDEDVVVGSPVANRTRVETEGLIGFFVNMLPLRVDLAGDPGFSALLARVREQTLAAYAHQDLPFEKLVEALQPVRHLGRTPLFQVSLTLQNAPFQAVELPGLSWSPLPLETGTAKFDLSLLLSEEGEEIAATLEYKTGLFDGATAERLLGHFARLLAGAAADPERPLSGLRLLDAAEERMLVADLNSGLDPGSGRTWALPVTIHELLRRQAERTPGRIAAVGPQGEMTYRELDERSMALAGSIGAGALDRRIALLADPDPQVLVGMLAILKAGGGFVPLDPRHPDDRLAWVLDDSACEVLLTQRRHLERAEGLARGRRVLCLDAGREGAALSAAREPRSLAYVIYTSGSTGRPKGVQVSHESLVPMLRWGCGYFGLGEHTRVLQSLSFCFDFGVFELLTTLLAGGAIVFPGEEATGDPAAFAREIVRHGINTLHTTPAFARELAASGEALRGLAIVHLGGEALSRDTVARIHAAAPRAAVYNGYGPTEATVNSTIFRLEDRPGGADDVGSPVVPIGRRSADNALYILDRAGRLVPFGVRGELYVGGIGVARGYLNRPDLTAERFVPDPFQGPADRTDRSDASGGRLYRTGDLVRYLPGGDIEFLGRIDQQVKVRGFRIEPGEIEAALREHPAVREAAVIARPDSAGGLRLVAYVVADAAAAELRAFLDHRLPQHMVPSAFVALAAVPLTPNGKLDRRALPEPELPGQGEEAAGTAPRTPEEELLTGLWAQLLGVPRVGVFDNFFALGGHSLLAARLAARVRDVLGVELPLRALFEEPTVAGLAARLAGVRRAEPTPPLVPRRREWEIPLSFAQERLWLLTQIEGTSAAYNIPSAVHLAGALDTAALGRALNEVVRRHESLRTRFESPSGEPRQVIEPPVPVPLPVVDLAGAPEPAALARAAAEAARPFDLARPPLVRACLLRRGAEDHILVLTLHHIAADGWSVRILVRELAVLYRGETLPEIPVQYADFSLWQRLWLSGETLEQEVAWWRERLAGAPEELPLPTDRPRTAAPASRGGSCRVTLPLAGGLGALCREQQATLFMALLAGFAVLLSRWSGEDDLVVGSPVANRTRVETEGLIGFFVNMLPLRVDLTGRPTFASLLARVREGALAAYAHQDLPFEKLVEALQPARHLGRTPLFQVALALQNLPFDPVELPGLSWRPLSLETGTAKFDLTLSLAETSGDLAASLEFRSDLFDGTTAGRLLSGFATLLPAAVADPSCRIEELPLLSAAERQALLVEWNATAASHPEELCLHELIEAQVDRTPGAVAVSFEGDDLTYRDLDRRANRLARRLRSLGVGPEVKVGIAAERSLDLVVGLLAILKAGGAYVPIDPTYPEDRLAYMLADARVPVLLTQSRIAGALPESGALPVLLDPAEAFDTENAERLDTAMTPDNLAYVIYTSGSTGRPKGAMNTHRAIVNRLLWMQAAYGLDASDRVLQKTPFSFDVSVWEFFWPLLVGARLVVARPGGHQDPAYLVRLIGEQRVTTLHFVPSMLAVFLEEPNLAPCRTLRRVIASGEALSLAHQERFFARLGEGCGLHNLYGPTEAAVDVTFWACERGSGRRSVPIGRPIDNLRIHILDPGLRPAPVGVAGHLHIGGVGLARGYHDRPALTAERFIPDPVGGEPGARLYATGDLARHLADGAIEYLGRIDHQVKLRGFRIELGEIEAILCESPLVAEAVVAGVAAGSDDARLAAYVVPDPERALPVRNLLRLQRENRLDGLSRTELPNGWTVLHRSRAETDFVYREIFEERTYLKHGVTLADGDVVFDVGANIGMFSLFAGSAARGVTVFAFEPIPQVYAALAANAELYGLDVRAFPCGLAEEPRHDRFTWYEHNSIVSGRYADAREEREVVRSYERGRWGEDAEVEASLLDELLAERMAGQEVEVELKTLSQVIRETGVERIDLLKIDVEKSERDVLLGIAPEDWPKIRQIVAEVHDIDGRVRWVRELLQAQGFAVAVEQEAELGDTPIYAVYAVRPDGLRAIPQASPRALCGSPERLLAELRAALAAKLPAYMIPSVFIPLEALPLSPNGKVDRRALPAPGSARDEAGQVYVAPRSDLEETLAEIWAGVLNVERVGVHDNFFTIGGHSLKATQVVAKLRQELQIDLPVRTLFEAPTIADLSVAVVRHLAEQMGEEDLAQLLDRPMKVDPVIALQHEEKGSSLTV